MKRILYKIHRVLGALLGILFVMWFVSGVVMIYHTFPSVRQVAWEHKVPLRLPLPPIEEVIDRLPKGETVKEMKLICRLNQPVFDIRTDKDRYLLPADTSQQILPLDENYFRSMAALWCQSEVATVDTLMELEQWIPFGRLREEMPIYKFNFSDDARTQLYLSSQSGEPLQCTTRESRFWAWVGAIPHWVYFTRLRQDIDLWKNTVIILSSIGILMVVTGLYTGIQVARQHRKTRRGGLSPYRKRWHRWHHVGGLLFGIFVLTWIFSGMMSLAELPDWMAKEHKSYPVRQTLSAGTLPLENYVSDYRRAIAALNGEIVELTWSRFCDKPVYLVRTSGQQQGMDASGPELRPLSIGQDEACRAIQALHTGEDVQTPVWMTEYDTYYTDRQQKLSLPVWKVEVENDDHTCYYVNPSTAQVRSYNTRGRWHFWTYQGLHSLKFGFLLKHPFLWYAVMWLLLLGGTAVSLTGVVLACRKYLTTK